MLLAMNLQREVLQHDNDLPHTTRATVDFLPLKVDADVSVQRQSKDVWRVSRFQGDGF
jgi:hypothetical protein